MSPGTKASDERFIEYEIGYLLLQERNRLKMGLKAVAPKIEMNFVSIYGWEIGRNFPATLARLGRWCGAYDLVAELTIRRKDGSVIYSKEL